MNKIEREIYKTAKHRVSIGREIMTDAETIVEQAKEIERYRNKNQYLEKALREEVARTAQWGDMIELEMLGEKRKFMLTDITIEQKKDCVPTVTIKGEMCE